MDKEQYQKNIIFELMNLEKLKPVETSSNTEKNINEQIDISNARSIEELELYLSINFGKKVSLVEGSERSNILFFFGKCNGDNQKIIDGKMGDLFDKMLISIKLERKDIALSSYIPRGLEEFEKDENFLSQIQILNYKLIETINPKFLIIMSNYCIKMLLASDLSSMSLRGKWFDFNTPNDVIPKRCRVIYEPEILINNPDLKKDAWEDLKEIRKQLGG